MESRLSAATPEDQLLKTPLHALHV